MRPSVWFRRRIHHYPIPGTEHDHISRQRRSALILIVTALIRVAIWSLLTIFYLAHVAFAVNLFKSVSFVAFISMLALILTDWGQYAASMAQLTAGDVHKTMVRSGHVIQADVAQLEGDIERLAQLDPGPEAQGLASEIRARLREEKYGSS